MAPVIRGKKGEHAKIFEDARKSGYVRVRADGSLYDLSEETSMFFRLFTRAPLTVMCVCMILLLLC